MNELSSIAPLNEELDMELGQQHHQGEVIEAEEAEWQVMSSCDMVDENEENVEIQFEPAVLRSMYADSLASSSESFPVLEIDTRNVPPSTAKKVNFLGKNVSIVHSATLKALRLRLVPLTDKGHYVHGEQVISEASPVLKYKRSGAGKVFMSSISTRDHFQCCLIG